MDTFDGDPNLFSRANAGDDSLFVVFYMGVLKNEPKSIEAGRPIFDDVECIRIIVPGDKNNIIDRPARADDKRRFGKQYQLFKDGRKEDEQISGTRLTEWPFLTRAQCEEFRYLGIHTVEQLAEVRDDITSRVPGMVQLKEHAKVWLGKTKSAAEAARTANEMAELRSKNETLERAVRELGDRLEQQLHQKAKA